MQMKQWLAILLMATLLALSTTALAVTYSDATQNCSAGVCLALSCDSGFSADALNESAQEYGLWAGVVLLACVATLCGGGVWRYHRHKKDGTSK